MKKQPGCHYYDQFDSCDDDFMVMEPDMQDVCKEPDENYDCKEMKLAHAYVPWQHYKQAFSPREALQKGTLFPELYGVYKIPQ